MDIRDQLNRFLLPLKNRIQNMVCRCTIKLVDDTKKVQNIQASLLAGELKSDIEHYQEYGFSSVPKVGMEGLIAFIGGDRSNGVIVAIGDREFRLKSLQPGEVAIYTDEGDFIKLGREHHISVSTLHLEVTATEDTLITTKKLTINAETGVDITTPAMTTSADFSAGGEVKDVKGTMNAMRDVFNGHTHTGNMGAPTSSPSSPM